MRLTALCLSTSLLFASCAAAQTADQPDAGRYKLNPGDVISVRFFFNPELNDETQLRPDGDISLQLIGELHAGDKTVSDVAQELEKRYATEIRTPRVTVQVKSYAAQKAYVTGEVMRPGAVSLIGGMDAVSAVAEAGGVRQTGKAHSLVLVRKGPDGKLLARKLTLVAGGPPLERLRPFDLLIVPPRKITRVDRFVDEYIRQALPGNLQGGFQYLYNRTASAVSVIPF